jgi:hypothetical protein
MNLDNATVIHRENHNLVQSVLVRSSHDSLQHRPLFSFHFDKNYLPGRYAVQIFLRIPAHDRILRIREPKPSNGKIAEITQFILTEH